MTLWLSLMKNSRTHPAQLSKVAPFFAEVAPLEADEIESLIAGLQLPPYMDRGEFARMCGIAESTAGLRIRGAGVEPIRPRAQLLYRTADLLKARDQYEYE